MTHRRVYTEPAWTAGPTLQLRMTASLTLLREAADALNTGPHATLLRTVISHLAPLPLADNPRTAAVRMQAVVNHLDRHPERDLLQPLVRVMIAWAVALDIQNEQYALTHSATTEDVLAELADNALAAGMTAHIDVVEKKIHNIAMSLQAATAARVAKGSTTPSAREVEADRELATLHAERDGLNATLDALWQ